MIGLVLDEHLSPKVAAGLRQMGLPVVVHSMNEWKGGTLMGRRDAEILAEAAREQLILVTYDCKTIPTLLKLWREQGRSHAGVIYVSQRTVPSSDIGALVRALAWVIREYGGDDWTDRQDFLHYV
jgi:predicted nuclease of predicted toxin-antitoxin system